MRFLLTHRYFWPDTAPYASILRSIAENLVRDGHCVTVFCSIPSYRKKFPAPATEILNGIRVNRIWVFTEIGSCFVIRILNAIIYSLQLFFHILRLRPEIVTASTYPPVVAGFLASLGAKIVGAKFIYHIQDIHPESSVIQGRYLNLPLFAFVLRWLDNKTLKHADRIVVLSEDMKNTLLQRGLKIGDKIHLINNFLFEDFCNKISPIPHALEKPEGVMRVVFTGNMGRFQNLGPVVKAASLLQYELPDVQFLFLGSGEAVFALKQIAGTAVNITFVHTVPFAITKYVITNADLGVVSLSQGITSVSYPSKTLIYLGLGLPLLTFIDGNSHLAKDIKRLNLGLNIESEDPQVIAKKLRRFLKTYSKTAYTKHVKAFVDLELQMPITLRKWRSVVSFN